MAFKRDPLLVEVLASLGAGRVIEQKLHDEEFGDKVLLHGVRDGHDVVINPAANMIDTLIHELLHRIRPEWTERGVTRRTKQLIKQLSNEEIERIYDTYCAVKATRKKRRVV